MTLGKNAFSSSMNSRNQTVLRRCRMSKSLSNPISLTADLGQVFSNDTNVDLGRGIDFEKYLLR